MSTTKLSFSCEDDYRNGSVCLVDLPCFEIVEFSILPGPTHSIRFVIRMFLFDKLAVENIAKLGWWQRLDAEEYGALPLTGPEMDKTAEPG